MAKLTRKTQKIFAGSATSDQITEFGTAQDTPVYSTDLDTLQANSAYDEGYASAVLADEAPYLEDTNALHYIATKQLAYLFQEGIAEYDSGTTYYIGSIVKKTGTSELYKSLTDNNTGNALTDDTKWLFLGDLSYLTKSIIPIGTCSTASATAEKAVTLAGYTEVAGASVQLVFSNANTASNPTLNFNAGTARAVKNIAGDACKYLPANTKLNFVFDGTNYICLNANVGFGMPDFSNPVSKTWNSSSPYQAECDGYLQPRAFCQSPPSTNATLQYSVNSDLSSPLVVWAMGADSETQNTGMGFISITKGLYYKARGGTSGQTLTFYPAKGAS